MRFSVVRCGHSCAKQIQCPTDSATDHFLANCIKVEAGQMRAARRARSARFAPFFQLYISTLAITAVALSLLILQFVLRSSPKHRISQNRKSLDSLVSNIAADGVRFGDKVSDTPPGKQDCTVGKTVILSNGVSSKFRIINHTENSKSLIYLTPKL